MSYMAPPWPACVLFQHSQLDQQSHRFSVLNLASESLPVVLLDVVAPVPSKSPLHSRQVRAMQMAHEKAGSNARTIKQWSYLPRTTESPAFEVLENCARFDADALSTVPENDLARYAKHNVPTRALIKSTNRDEYRLSDAPTLCADDSSFRSSKKQNFPETTRHKAHGTKSSGLDEEAQVCRPLPGKTQHPLIRNLRHKLIPVYGRLFSIIFLGNLAAFIWYCNQWATQLTLVSLATVAVPIAVNLFITSLFRTDYWINFLYSTVLWVPHSTPLCIRRRLAKVYEFGGVHSGAGVATAIWAIFFTVQITRAKVLSVPHLGVAAVAVTYLLIVLLLAIIIAAHPKIRRAQHNKFEAIHRFCGWGALALFWALALLLSHSVALSTNVSLAGTLFTSPTIYFLFATTFLVILPWLHLRHLPCYAQTLSQHAVRLYFPNPKVGPVEGVRISTSPLFEWHSFAAIPTRSIISPRQGLLPTARAMNPGPQYSILVSRAGDWTTAAIGQEMEVRNGRHSSQAKALRRYWIRGVPIRGVALVVRLFQRAVIVTTGSGIGPALSMLAGADTVPCRLVWSVPAPEATYGAQVVAEVRAADPNAVIWDTRARGRPDMIKLAWDAYVGFAAEAVVVISNPKLTELVVYGLESRGVPAYGPIFDS